MLVHVVFVRFKKDSPREVIDRILRELRDLPRKVSEIRSYQVGEDVLHLQRSYDLAIIGRFDDLDALRRYDGHPYHAPVAAALRGAAEQMASVDFWE